MNDEKLTLHDEGDYWRGGFTAMASPCEVLMEVDERPLAERILRVVSDEAWRIEKKFSRYRDDNIVYRLHHAGGERFEVDDETARLIDFSVELYRLSDGLFDITSGVLREAWRFDGSDRLPSAEQVESLLARVGWDKVAWRKPYITLPAGMEIDFGGIGKEYAVDRCIQKVRALTGDSVLVNFGGDLAVSAPRKRQPCWSVGRLITGAEQNVSLFRLYKGAIATSGDAHRYLLRNGVRYSHVLNPKTGWPVENPPHTVSVAAPSCVQAGMMSTLALLHGEKAEAFLKVQEVACWIG